MSYVDYYMKNKIKCSFTFNDYKKGLTLYFSCLNSALQFLDSYQRISNSETYEFEVIAILHDDNGLYDIRYERGTTGYYYAERIDAYRIGIDSRVYRWTYWYDCPRASY